jgi:hypothetical protein
MQEVTVQDLVFVIIKCVHELHISGDLLVWVTEYSSLFELQLCEFCIFNSFIMSISISISFYLIVQHELGLAADEGVRQLVEQSEGEVSRADKAVAMTAAIEKRVVALRIKMGKLVAVANPELTDGWLREVGT